MGGLKPLERAVLVDVQFKDSDYRDPWPREESLAELKELAESSGLNVVESIGFQRGAPTPAFFIGKGQAESLHTLCHGIAPAVVVFGQDLAASQQRNIEELIGIKTIDRTQLILDIFAQRANSLEGKVQVELAQLQYLLPRLMGKGILLSRLGGGIGTRGPGEQKLEVDRRRIRARINRLKKELAQVGRRRGVARRKRTEEEVPVAALIGYTNAGKSTLLNKLTHAQALAEDRLFSTLDPLTRRLILPNRQPILLTDTVGFLHRLPHHLIEAFRATLQEVTDSDLLLHVMDSASPLLEEKEAAVEEVLKALDAQQRPSLLVLNQCDRLSAERKRELAKQYPEAVQLSALTGEGLSILIDRLAGLVGRGMKEIELLVPREDVAWLTRIYKEGQVLNRQDLAEGVQVKARVPSKLHGQLVKSGLIKS